MCRVWITDTGCYGKRVEPTLVHSTLLLAEIGLGKNRNGRSGQTYAAGPGNRFFVAKQSNYARPSGNIYLAGNAIVDPSTSQTTVLVVKLNPQASRYLYVRYVGGSVNHNAIAIAV